MPGTKLYSQEALRDADGDFIIHQYSEVSLPSGLIVSQHVGTATVTSGVSNMAAIALMDVDEIFHYEPDLSVFREFPIADVVENRRTLRFCIEPHEAQTFCVLSSKSIADAYRALTYRKITPDIDFNAILKDDAIDEDDLLVIKTVGEGVSDILNGVDNKKSSLIGQYL